MGSKDPVPTVDKWITFPWEKSPTMPISQEEVRELQNDMATIKF
jgi:hypothetical protein